MVMGQHQGMELAAVCQDGLAVVVRYVQALCLLIGRLIARIALETFMARYANMSVSVLQSAPTDSMALAYACAQMAESPVLLEVMERAT